MLCRKFILLVLIVAGMSIVISSCIPFFRRAPGFDVSNLIIEKKRNGYVVEIVSGRKIDGIEAFVTQSNWLVITIASTNVDIERLKSLKPVGIVSKFEIERFKTSVQVSMRLTVKIKSVEVVNDQPTTNVFVNLLTD